MSATIPLMVSILCLTQINEGIARIPERTNECPDADDEFLLSMRQQNDLSRGWVREIIRKGLV